MSVQEAEAYLKALEKESVDLADREVEIRLEQARSSSPAPGLRDALLSSVREGHAELTQHYHGGEDECLEHMESWLDEHEELIRAAVASSPVPASNPENRCEFCHHPRGFHFGQGEFEPTRCRHNDCYCEQFRAAPVSVGDEDGQRAKTEQEVENDLVRRLHSTGSCPICGLRA